MKYFFIITRSAVFLFIIVYLSITHCYAGNDRGIALRPTSPTGETVKGNQWLFVIGINNYLQWPKLSTAVNDAKAVRDVLLSRYHFGREHLVELYDADATRSNILSTLRRLAEQVKPDDSLLVYYAGHGHLDNITKEGSWIPIESGIKDPSAWVSNHDVKNYLNSDAIHAKHILLVSDSCFAGDFFRGSRGGIPEVTDAVIKKAYIRASRQAITSGGVEPVSDAGFGGNSVFSHFFVQTLKENDKLFLIPSDLFPAVKSGVAQNAEQFPQFGALYGVGGQEGGEFVFFLKQENRMQNLSADEKTLQAELQQLKKMESDAAKAKSKEQAEIAKKEKEVAELDAQIAGMKAKLGTGAEGPNDRLEAMAAMVEKKEGEARRLEDLKKQRETEEHKRQVEIAGLKTDANRKRRAAVERDIIAYEKIVKSQYGADMAPQAYRSIVNKYPEAKNVAAGNVEGLKMLLINPLEMVPVKGGCFQMGDSFGDGHSDEKPIHEVCVADFTIGKFEVTQYQWKLIMGQNPSNFNGCGDDCPVENICWNDIQEYIKKLNMMTGKNYRLPTEAEWEYAARSGGRTEKYAGTNIESELYDYAWYSDNASGKTHPVGQKRPNLYGIYDMTGNVWEWVQDWYDINYYRDSPRDNPTCLISRQYKSFRGGSWNNMQRDLRTTTRNWNESTERLPSVGFRLVEFSK